MKFESYHKRTNTTISSQCYIKAEHSYSNKISVLHIKLLSFCYWTEYFKDTQLSCSDKANNAMYYADKDQGWISGYIRQLGKLLCTHVCQRFPQWIQQPLQLRLIAHVPAVKTNLQQLSHVSSVWCHNVHGHWSTTESSDRVEPHSPENVFRFSIRMITVNREIQICEDLQLFAASLSLSQFWYLCMTI